MAALIIRAGQFNRMLGTNLAPWDLEFIPADWLDALEKWVDDLPRAKAWRSEVDESLSKLRSRKAH